MKWNSNTLVLDFLDLKPKKNAKTDGWVIRKNEMLAKGEKIINEKTYFKEKKSEKLFKV